MQKELVISIIIPIYNVENYLFDCLESVRSAVSSLPVEVLLIDDGSTDRSSEIARKYAAKYTKFEYHHLEHRGVSVARNYAVEIAKGEYLAFMDSDDLVDVNIYTDLLAVARKHHCDMVICDVMRLRDRKLSYSSLHRRAYFNIRDLSIDLERNPSLIFDSTICNRLIKRSLFTDNNILFPEGYRYEDVLVVQMLHFYAKNVRFVRTWGYKWRIRTEGASSITKSHDDTKNLTDKIHVLELLRQFAQEHGASQQYMENLDYRILLLEFNGTIDALKKLDENKALRHLDIAAKYIEESVDLDVMKLLPVYDKQKIDYVLKRDLHDLIRLLNYKALNYDSAPIVRNEGSYELILPETIFPIPDRDPRYDHARIPSFQGIDSVNLNDSTFSVHGHIYLRRINVPDINSQKVQAFLVNAIEDGELTLPTKNELRPSLTLYKGIMVSTDDYDEHHYNYDGAGFCFSIDLDELTANTHFRGRNYILIDNENPFGSKLQLLRYASKKVRTSLTNCSIDHGECRITISLNALDMLEILVEERPADDKQETPQPKGFLRRLKRQNRRHK